MGGHGVDVCQIAIISAFALFKALFMRNGYALEGGGQGWTCPPLCPSVPLGSFKKIQHMHISLYIYIYLLLLLLYPLGTESPARTGVDMSTPLANIRAPIS